MAINSTENVSNNNNNNNNNNWLIFPYCNFRSKMTKFSIVKTLVHCLPNYTVFSVYFPKLSDMPGFYNHG